MIVCTDVSRQPIDLRSTNLNLKGKTDRLFRNVCTKLPFYDVCFLLGNSPSSEFYMPMFRTLCLFHLHRRIGMTPIRLWRWNRQSVPKRWHRKLRRRGITQKKACNIQNKMKFEIKNTILRCVKSQNNADLIYNAAGTWNRTCIILATDSVFEYYFQKYLRN